MTPIARIALASHRLMPGPPAGAGREPNAEPGAQRPGNDERCPECGHGRQAKPPPGHDNHAADGSSCARGFAMLRHPAGALAAALKADSSACDWAPRVPTRLYLATGDEQVVNANTWHCQAAFAAHSARVTAVNLGAPDHAGSRHFGSNVAGTAQIVRWFSQLAA